MERSLHGLVLVTGATGFLGGHLVHSLLEAGLQVRATGRSLEAGLALARAGADFRPVDLRDAAGMRAACRGVEAVVHAGAQVSPWGRERDYHEINVRGTEHVIAGCLAEGVRRLVYVSTPSVATRLRDQLGIVESDPLPESFISDYAATKKLGEDRVAAARSSGLETVVLRPKAIYGPGDTAIFPRFIAAARRGRLRRIAGRDPITNLTHVDDAVRALRLALEAKAADGGTYYITGGAEVRLWAVVDRALEAVGAPLPRRELSLARAEQLSRLLPSLWRRLGLPGEPPLSPFTLSILAYSQTYRIAAAERDLGYHPRVSFEEGIETVLRSPAARGERRPFRPLGRAQLATGVELRAELLGSGRCALRWPRLVFPDGGFRGAALPALFALLEHPTQGTILFDTGYSPRFEEATRRWPFRLYRLATPVTVSAEETALAQLHARGIDAHAVRWVIVSHFDPDHIGGLRDFPEARVVCSVAAWRAASAPPSLHSRLLPGHLPDDLAGRLLLLPEADGEPLPPFEASIDLFGDGSLRLLELPGHAPGQLGALLQLRGGERWLLAADACWSRLNLPGGRHGAHRRLAHDRRAQEQTYQRLQLLQANHPELILVPSHCPSAAAALLSKPSPWSDA